MAPTFGIPGRVVFEIETSGGTLPSAVHTPNDLDTTVWITCTEEEALEIEAWLRIAARQRRHAAEASLYLRCAALIAGARGDDR